MRERINLNRITKKEIELIGKIEQRKIDVKEKVLRYMVKEGMSFKQAKKELKIRVKISCLNRELEQLNN